MSDKVKLNVGPECFVHKGKMLGPHHVEVDEEHVPHIVAAMDKVYGPAIAHSYHQKGEAPEPAQEEEEDETEDETTEDEGQGDGEDEETETEEHEVQDPELQEAILIRRNKEQLVTLASEKLGLQLDALNSQKKELVAAIVAAAKEQKL